MGEATYTVGQLLVTGLLSKVQNLSSATRQSKFQNSFHTFLFCFLSDRLLAYQIKTKNDTLWVKATPLLISYLSSISCTQIKIHKRGRCGGRQCSNGSPIFFFCPPRWTFFYCLLLQGVRDTCEKNLSRIHWVRVSFCIVWNRQLI